MKTFPEINAYLKEELVTAMGCTEPIAVEIGRAHV